MNLLAQVLVHVDASERSVARVRFARALAATLPWLTVLERIDLVAEPAAGIGEPCWPGPVQLGHWLRGHGFAGTLVLY